MDMDISQPLNFTGIKEFFEAEEVVRFIGFNQLTFYYSKLFLKNT